jgi:CHASE2 domain-containing sensor protein
MDYDSGIHSSGLGFAALGLLAWQQLWLPIVALSAVLVAAVVIRVVFRARKAPTDV